MTEREIMKNTRDLIQHALDCSFTVFTDRQHRIALQLRDAVRVRVDELEAAEKEPEPQPDPGLETRITLTEHRAGCLEWDMKRLFRYVEQHTHTTNHPTGLGDPTTMHPQAPWIRETEVKP